MHGGGFCPSVILWARGSTQTKLLLRPSPPICNCYSTILVVKTTYFSLLV